MRKTFSLSWPQCIILLALAGVIVTTPEVKPAQFVVAGVVAAVALVGIVMKLTGKGHHRTEQKNKPPG